MEWQCAPISEAKTTLGSNLHNNSRSCQEKHSLPTWRLQLLSGYDSQIGWHQLLHGSGRSENARASTWRQITIKKLIQDLNLVGLNTWNPHQGPTFINTLGRSSKIDFIFTRMFHADRLAKNVGHLYDAPFLQGGPHHIPLLVSLGQRMCRPSRHQTTLFPTNIRTRCINDFRDDNLTWQGCMNEVNATLRHTTVDSLEQLTEILNNGILRTYSTSKLNYSSMAQGLLKRKWHHFRQARAFAYTSLQTVFQKWHHIVRFKVLDKSHAQQVKLHRRCKLDGMMKEAHEAHQNHDSYKLYKIVQRHCPKQRIKTIRLKSDQGAFLTPVEETAEYCRYIADKWSGPQMVLPPMNPPGIPFTVDELEIAIANIPGTKAVAPLFAPGVAWKSQAHFLAPWIYSQLTAWWTTSPPFIPQVWCDGWVAFLPKPNKAATKVENLRILALQEPIGKCIIQLLTRHSIQQSFVALVQHPQFAYLPLRSTRDALLRVAGHCAAVRRLLQSQARNIHIPRQSQPRLQCCGGIQIFLDLHRAFDQLPRQLIIQALEPMPLSPSLFSLLTHWHHGTHYHINLNDSTRQVQVSRGVRQGCCAAPYIWACVISAVLDKLEHTISLEWIQKCSTIFADDFHLACTFTSEEELQQALTFIGHILDELTQMDFILNPNKSSVVLRGTGSRFPHWKKN